MKKFIKIGSILTFALMIGLISCKKEKNVKPDKDQKEQLFAVKIQSTSNEGTQEKGIVIGTKEELGKAFNGDKGILLKKAARKNNVFVLAPEPVGPVTDPFQACWDEIYSYRDAHWDSWLAQANASCQVLHPCITCPEAGIGLFVTFIVKPTSIKCVEAKLELAMVKFDFGENVYDTPEVYEYIQKM